jgi:4-hydroxythreonine-4-phosphate dehydrogenase
MGDPAGIGGEVTLKSLRSIGKKSVPVIVGDLKVIDYLARLYQSEPPRFRLLNQGKPGDIEFVDLGIVDQPKFGVIEAEYGAASYQYIVEALKLISSGDVSAIVTCPINKAAIRAARIPFVGHTELLAHFGGVDEYVMMMANRKMRVSLVTIHIPLKEVPPLITVERVFSCLSVTYRSLKTNFKLSAPRIKVCGLNPHAGEGGIMGDEEAAIREAIRLARSQDMNVDGPYPADTLFHKVDCDAYVAMYHDQGLIPVKTTGFEKTVNITLGLPFVRTSPGHGTGYDIAGKGIANPSGLIEAYRVAESMTRSPVH